MVIPDDDVLTRLSEGELAEFTADSRNEMLDALRSTAAVGAVGYPCRNRERPHARYSMLFVPRRPNAIAKQDVADIGITDAAVDVARRAYRAWGVPWPLDDRCGCGEAGAAPTADTVALWSVDRSDLPPSALCAACTAAMLEGLRARLAQGDRPLELRLARLSIEARKQFEFIDGHWP